MHIWGIPDIIVAVARDERRKNVTDWFYGYATQVLVELTVDLTIYLVKRLKPRIEREMTSRRPGKHLKRS